MLFDNSVKKAVMHCIEIMGLKNPDKLAESAQGGFIHTNTRGRKRLFTPYMKYEYFKKYKEDAAFREKKLRKVMTYYIVEESADV